MGTTASGFWFPDTSYTSGVRQAFEDAADAAEGVMASRARQTFRPADAAALAALAGTYTLRVDDYAYQIDTGVQYRWDGAAWVSLDTDWINATLASGATVSDGLTPAYRRLNDVVYLRGRMQANGSGAMFTVPAGFRVGQAGRIAVMLGSSGTTAGVLILGTDGTLSSAASANLNLAAVSWVADA